jgi:aminoglycoside phosphotransferase (APT) family kinase protein
VLRKKPDGTLLPSAHAVDREYHVMRALQETGVPVPEMLGFCEDAEVVGTPFYVMAHVEGRIFWDPTLPELTRAERAALYDDVNRVIAKLHDVDYTAVGLRDYGRAGSENPAVDRCPAAVESTLSSHCESGRPTSWVRGRQRSGPEIQRAICAHNCRSQRPRYRPGPVVQAG